MKFNAMGFYIRKSVKVGPFRFNLSKSGIGISAGVKGLRFGAGPRGTYVHMGRGGLYYRKTLDTPTRRPPMASSRRRSDQDQPSNHQIPSNTHDPLQLIESGDVSKMVDSSAKNLLEELNSRRKKIAPWPISLFFGVLLTGWLLSQVHAQKWICYSTALLFTLLTIFLVYWDMLRKTSVLMYALEDEFGAAFESLCAGFDEMKKCKSTWHIASSGTVLDKKYHAGANALVSRSSINPSVKNPPFTKTNVPTPNIPVGTQTIYFLPDTVLVFDRKNVGAVAYGDLKVEVSDSKFIEDGPVPSDTEIVDHTYKFVNKNGGPDRRFSNNRQIPIVMYEEVCFMSESGLNERLQLSKCGAARSFIESIRKMSQVVHVHRTMIYCPTCETPARSDANICGVCGHRLSGPKSGPT